MSTVKFAPRQLVVLTDDARIKGYVHPVRMTILQMLAAEKRTVTSVAREMKVHPANITHHFKRLQRLDLIRLVETRDTGRNLEKYYAAVARNFVVRPRAKSAMRKQALALSILRDNLSAAIDRIRPGSKGVLALLASARLRDQDLGRFTKRLQALVVEFHRADAADGHSCSLNMSLYPDEANVRRPGRAHVEIK